MGDGDGLGEVFAHVGEGFAEFGVDVDAGDACGEGAGGAGDGDDFSGGVAERDFCGGGPVDEAFASGDEFDFVVDGDAGG